MNSQVLYQPEISWIQDAAKQACARIAPVWPLDKSIAVNPWWKMHNQTMPQVSATLKNLADVKMLMNKSYFQSLWNTQIQPQHLMAAADLLQIHASQSELLDYLSNEEKNIGWQQFGDLLDQQECHLHKMPWRDEVIQQVSQFCALYFQYPERIPDNDDKENGFYTAWLEVIKQDKGIEILMAAHGLNKQFHALPETINEVFELAQKNFGDTISQQGFIDYFHALLLDINGWASWMAHAAWQDAFDNQDNNLIHQLLAIRLAWDQALWQHTEHYSAENFSSIRDTFIQQLNTTATTQEQINLQQRLGWVWQRALELSFQETFNGKLLTPASSAESAKNTAPELQAIFCIDVRSEPIRRALEAQHSAIQTLGFAGFFGLPMDYAIAESGFQRPQLPGLLKASIKATQNGNSTQGKSFIFRQVAAKKTADAAPSTFGVVEAKGFLKAFDLLKSSFFPAKPAQGITPLITNQPWTLTRNNKPLSDEELAGLVAGILGAMGLTENFAPRVVLFGHASCTTNNPHAAGLDCGACGGQSGETNVKVLAQILNNPAVRHALQSHAIHIPESTQFIAGIHNTTTDELVYFADADAYTDESWKTWLLAATESAQFARAASVGIAPTQNQKKISLQFQQRANDWSQIRPEWGLANNAAFIVAPRKFTRHIDLQGRSFLHDYQWQKDSDFSILELIMTAPMVVTHWINMQYYASVVDNQKYGSGNKLLHNVVGGNIGVFEGNGGDLRIGLPFQSLHDGKQWRHQPLRLNIYLAAPREAILNIINKHSHLNDLVNNGWIYLFNWDQENNAIWQLRDKHWSLIKSITNET